MEGESKSKVGNCHDTYADYQCVSPNLSQVNGFSDLKDKIIFNITTIWQFKHSFKHKIVKVNTYRIY